MKHLVVSWSLLLGLIVGTVTLAATPVPVAAATASYVAVTPTRVADTRPDYSDYGTPSVPKGLTADGGTIRIPVAGRAGVPGDAAAVAINLTSTQATSRGYLTVYACDTAVPNTSNVNLQIGNPVANLVLTKIGAKGDICIFTRGTTHLIVDIVGYVPTNGSPALIAPTRIGDTRPGYGDYGTPSVPEGLTVDGGVIRVPVAGRAGIPTDASAVAINLTSTQATSRGYLTVYACDTTVPETSNVNLQIGNPVANLVFSKTGTKGDICIFTRGTTQLIVDLVGYVPNGASPNLTTPTRLGDTRPGYGDYGTPSVPKGLTTDGGTIRIPVTGRAGVPTDASAVAINLTATGATSRGYLTVYACDTAVPNTSNVNLQIGNPVANLVLTNIGAKGDICIFTRGTTHLIVDLMGYLSSAQINPPTPSTSIATTSTTISPNTTSTTTSTSTTVAPTSGCTIQGVAVTTDVTQAECDALVVFYNSTNGTTWNNNTGWNTPTDPCRWYGVSCVSEKLTRIELGFNNLTGTVPADIGTFTNLTRLDLGTNQIGGAIPAQIGNLVNVVSLRLESNKFTNVPSEIGNLTSLRYLRLQSNQIGAVPAEIGNLANLTYLRLDYNQISSVPTQIGNLANLTTLYLDNNQLAAIPTQIGDLANLTTLYLDNNQIGTIPTEIGKLTKLDTLRLEENQITAIPTEIGNLTGLTQLYLDDNKISGDVSAALRPLAAANRITILRLRGNNCPTASDPAVKAWLDIRNPGWDVC